MASHESDLAQFHQFVAEQLARGGDALTPEDCLDARRVRHPMPSELAESLTAIEEGLAQARRGEGTPLDEFSQRFRASKGTPEADA